MPPPGMYRLTVTAALGPSRNTRQQDQPDRPDDHHHGSRSPATGRRRGPVPSRRNRRQRAVFWRIPFLRL